MAAKTGYPKLEGLEAEEFARFWRIYPRHKSQPDAAKAWQQTAEIRPSIEELLQSVMNFRQECRNRDILMVPYPATWLRRAGWADEPDPEPTYEEMQERYARKRWG
jgi:hypothetical protein